MNHSQTRIAILALLLPALLGSAPLAASAQDGPDPGDEPLVGSRALLARVLEEHASAGFDSCAVSGTVVLNEICAVGTECDRDVRIADFVELYNPGPRAVDLSCFVLSARDEEPFVPAGTLEPNALTAFGEKELGFRITKARDFVALHRVEVDADGRLTLHEVERVDLAESHAHAFRWPDGGTWYGLSVREAQADWPGSYGEPNTPPRDAPTAEPGRATAR